ncbi:TIGR01777 family oxidoreductase [Parachlamydia sp. AcF125]|uniref:TIGR01777 family oxidoreductase n=1 Tax=Parachlamydia sp. AcF125 TaxID=2795736 RepID=UPI001BC8EC84|nr:TIGR01777 family oxidoreductase [Parachlamydia sp. AcF125]MBS4168757.1 Epimerase family protein [Parachlamydia sp. AcF125]
MNIVISGSSGLIGTALITFFREQGHLVKRLVRKKGGLAHDEIGWDPETGIIDSKLLEGSDVLINLAGENIAHGRWNDFKKKKILNSRLKTTQLLSKTLHHLKSPPSLWINASAIGYYGNQDDKIVHENTPAGTSFLSKVCKEWEASAQAPPGIRTVYTRFGLIMTPKGGALKQMLLPFRLGLGGILGTGKQYMSWMTMQDLVRAIDHIIKTPSLKGPVNMVTPFPVTNQEFTHVLGKVLNRPTVLSMPAFAARLIFGEMAEELLLSSMRVEPKQLINSSFTYTHPKLEEAMHALLEDGPHA